MVRSPAGAASGAAMTENELYHASAKATEAAAPEVPEASAAAALQPHSGQPPCSSAEQRDGTRGALYVGKAAF
jgi:hypothetical protein